MIDLGLVSGRSNTSRVGRTRFDELIGDGKFF